MDITFKSCIECSRHGDAQVLFTVEITAEEVQRTCYEASLLYSLQSLHVVRVSLTWGAWLLTLTVTPPSNPPL
jgi:hypothetical protein